MLLTGRLHGDGGLCRVHGAGQISKVFLPLLRIDEGKRPVAVEPGHADPCRLRRSAHRRHVPVLPMPELHRRKAVPPRRGDPLQKGELFI